jgi:crossover junction endodeoxyribonuclease RusA
VTAVDLTYTLTLDVVGKHSEVLLSSNQRLHWRAKAKRTKYWRELAAVTATSAINRGDVNPVGRAHIVAVLTFPTAHRRDIHNYQPTLKACVDGIVDAGLLPDDSDKHLVGPDLRANPVKGPASIRLEITELPAVQS